MNTFYLLRKEDKSGVSGTGVVAEGAVATDGSVVLRWLGEKATWELLKSIDHVITIHGHEGATKIIFGDYYIENEKT